MKYRSITICSVLLFYILLLGGCTQEKKEVSIRAARPAISLEESQSAVSETDTIPGQDYTNGAPLKVLEANGLTISQISSFNSHLSDASGSYYVYNSITGLAKTSIENKINDTISQNARSWAEDKPVAAEYPEDDFSQQCIDGACYGAVTNISWNYCDYISGTLTRTIDYYEPSDMTHQRFTYISPINFDLRTGEAFSLKALFTENCNYMSVISKAVMQYGRDSGLSMTGFMGLTKEPAFCLSEGGLVIYTDASYEKIGLMRNTPITVSFDNFGSGWAIGRPCDLTIYTDPGDPSYSLLLQRGNTQCTGSTVYYDEGERLKASLSWRYPEGFPEAVLDDARNYVEAYLPSTNEVSAIRKDETKYLKLHFNMEGSVIGSYYCITLTGTKEQSDEDGWNTRRYYVYDSGLNPVSYNTLFTNAYDCSTLLSNLTTEIKDNYIYDGYLFETEINIADTDFILDTQEIRFATNPVTLTHLTVSAEGADVTETFTASLEFSVPYDEIGIANLTIFEQ